jgi:hypothetical protein
MIKKQKPSKKRKGKKNKKQKKELDCLYTPKEIKHIMSMLLKGV